MNIIVPSIEKIRENNNLILSKNQKLMNANRTILRRYTQLIDKIHNNKVTSVDSLRTKNSELYI